MEFKYQDNVFGKTLKEIKSAIKGTRFENHVFLVGGAVRDCMLGLPMKDIDLCINIPNGGMLFAEWMCKEYGCYKEESNPCLFPKYGTAKFSIRSITELSNVEIECVQTRKEQYHSDSRKPETVFGTIEEDAKRRDLTINSLYVNLSNDTIIDPCGNGIDDICNCVIRTPSDPSIVFEDDPLRMLRVIRFATKLGWGIDKETWVGIVNNVYRIGIISQERITDELGKILLCEKPSIGINRLRNCGLLKVILPEVYSLIGVVQGVQHFGDVYDHTMSVVDKTSRVLNHRWAGLLHDIGKPQTRSFVDMKVRFLQHEVVGELETIKLLKRLKFSNNDVKQISLAVRQHMRFKTQGDNCPSPKAIRKLISDVGEDNIPIILDVINADNNSHAEKYNAPNQVNKIIKKINELKNDSVLDVKLPINGNDIMLAFNLKPSPKIGIYLDAIKAYCLDKPNATKEECLEHIKTILT